MQKGGRRRPAASGADTRAVTATPSPEPRRTRRILVGLLLGALTLAVFWPLLASEFVFLDDPEYVFENRGVISGLTWPGVRWAFTTGHAANWHPLTWLSHMADVSLFGLKPAGHHATNLLLHTIAAILVFLAFQGLSGSVGRSAWIAALFAVHPAHVESVAWISERKDVLSAVFWFATILAYAVWVRRRGAGRYALLLLLFAAGLMSKPMVVTLPVVLLLLDYWPLGRFAGNDRLEPSVRIFGKRIVEKLPLFLLAMASSVLTFLVQRAGGAVRPLEAYPLGVRLGNAILAYVRYLRVAFWPTDLAVFYPHPGKSITLTLVAAGALLLFAITAAVVAMRRSAPFLLVGWTWFVVTLLPVIGLVQVGNQATADRYTYIPYVGLFLAIAWGGAWIADRFGRGRSVLRAVAIASIMALAVTAALQARVWKDSETLLLHAIRVTRNNDVAQNNLGNYYNTIGRPADALPHLQEALRLRPKDPAVLVNIGHSLFLLKRFDEAAAKFSEALQRDPSDDVAMNNLARVRYLQGDVPESIRLYRAALVAQPDWIDSRKRLVLALLLEEQNAAALLELERVVSRFPKDEESRQLLDQLSVYVRDPQDASARRLRGVLAAEHRTLGVALMERKRNGEAATQLDRALALFPDDPLTHLNRGVLFSESHRLDEAAAEFRETLRLDPRSALAHTDLGYVFFLQGLREEAIAQHREALRIQPDFPLARNNLAIAEKESPVPARPGRD
ncbi:MAG TPA: tetratricopeptide repeat protein [Thermoanaerobaculia bacterium]